MPLQAMQNVILSTKNRVDKKQKQTSNTEDRVSKAREPHKDL